MSDNEVLTAVCCLAGADGDVTVEELQVLDGLAARAGIEKPAFRALMQSASKDEEFRQEQIDVAKRDAAGALKTLIAMAGEDDTLGEGKFTMLLWRIATNQLDVSPEQFAELLAAET